MSLTPKEISFNQVKQKKDVKITTNLIVRLYEDSGYISEQDKESQARFIEDIVSSPQTIVVGAFLDSNTVGNICIINDSDKGVPLDSLFKDELGTIRNRGMSIVEIGQFVVDHKTLSRQTAKNVSLMLMKIVMHVTLDKGIDTICIGVNPKHVSFYKHIGFKELSLPKDYEQVNGAPCVPMYLNIKLALKKAARPQLNVFIKELFGNPPQKSLIQTFL